MNNFRNKTKFNKVIQELKMLKKLEEQTIIFFNGTCKSNYIDILESIKNIKQIKNINLCNDRD